MPDDRDQSQKPIPDADHFEHEGEELVPQAHETGDDADVETQTEAPVVRRPRRSMFDDPVVRALAITSGLIMILFLATVVGVLTSGLLAPTGPRTLAEKELATARNAVSAGTAEPRLWGKYVATLVDAGQFGRARSVLSEARKNLDDEGTGEFDLAEARIQLGEEKYEAAIEAGQRAMEQVSAAYDEVVSKGGLSGSRAQIRGLHENYYFATLLVAEANEELGNWDEAIANYDIYIGKFRGAADILIDRGNAKFETGDKAGAEKDFRDALRFVPDSREARAALEKIGAGE